MSEESTKNTHFGETTTSKEATPISEEPTTESLTEALKRLSRTHLLRDDWITGHNWGTSGDWITKARQPITGSHVQNLLDPSGKPIEVTFYGHQVAAGTERNPVILTIHPDEFERLSAKTSEVLAAATLAQERIAKDQEEIALLKKETREMLRRLRAA